MSVAAYWFISDQAASVPGLHIGPKWMTGKTRSGNLFAKNPANLIYKDAIIQADGKGALEQILQLMADRSKFEVMCGIYPGMMIEKEVESEYGGGMDQIQVEATEADISRCAWRVYVYEEEESTFNKLLKQHVIGLSGFAPGVQIHGIGPRDVFETAKTIVEKVQGLLEDLSPNTDLQKASKSKKTVTCLITGKNRPTRKAICVHKHRHSLGTIRKEILQALGRTI